MLHEVPACWHLHITWVLFLLNDDGVPERTY